MDNHRISSTDADVFLQALPALVAYVNNPEKKLYFLQLLGYWMMPRQHRPYILKKLMGQWENFIHEAQQATKDPQQRACLEKILTGTSIQDFSPGEYLRDCK